MGSPGSGKTTVGQLLAERLGKHVIDVDNDHLEKIWKMTVAEKVSNYIYLFLLIVFICICSLAYLSRNLFICANIYLFIQSFIYSSIHL